MQEKGRHPTNIPASSDTSSNSLNCCFQLGRDWHCNNYYKRWPPPPSTLNPSSFFVTTVASPLLRQCHFSSNFLLFSFYLQSLVRTASSTIHLISLSPIFQTIFHISHQLSITVIRQDAHIHFIRAFSHCTTRGSSNRKGLEILNSN